MSPLVTTTLMNFPVGAAAPRFFRIASRATFAANTPSTIASTSGAQVFQFMTVSVNEPASRLLSLPMSDGSIIRFRGLVNLRREAAIGRGNENRQVLPADSPLLS